eukprot:TRINITY_DN6305_c0_g4_i6.p1 TRINITY_DN6305_c0_g4~~TRINITY_DN6305_c0_g4_i6.p1  ORF type:complete len:134 (+),score=18.28 TRINITY_DN6305_c0_g4_i6:48-449(+)
MSITETLEELLRCLRDALEAPVQQAVQEVFGDEWDIHINRLPPWDFYGVMKVIQINVGIQQRMSLSSLLLLCFYQIHFFFYLFFILFIFIFLFFFFLLVWTVCEDAQVDDGKSERKYTYIFLVLTVLFPEIFM